MVKRAAEVRLGDCREVMASMDAESVDAIVTDPPYGLSFMGKGWDHGVPGEEFWAEALRVAKPGAHLLAFGGTRTFHRLACAIEDAGWDIRDCVMWVYGSGFPKSHDVSKAIDKAAGAEREVVGSKLGLPGYSLTDGKGGLCGGGFGGNGTGDGECRITAPATDAARQWSGWGTALKPAWEPIIVARKPLCGTVAENVLRHGTGGINVDGCRIGTESTTTIRSGNSGANGRYGKDDRVFTRENPPGRWPANLIHDGSDEVESLTGSAARFFYCAKASKADRDEGLEARPVVRVKMNNGNDADGDLVGDRFTKMARNTHPTVKPTELMRYLCRLVTPPGGLILDPFCGSGSTGKAAVVEGFRFIGIEREAEYVEIARARISAFAKDASLFTW